MSNKDNDVENTDLANDSEIYADQVTTQLKKGLLSYCVLLVCEDNVYTSEIITRLKGAELDVVEGTIYPLLARMQKDGLLTHSWQESPQGPPRKYYQITDFGRAVRSKLQGSIGTINCAIQNLEGNK